MNKHFLFTLLLSSLHFLSIAQPQGWEWNYLRQLESNRTVSANHFNKTISDLSDPVALAIPTTCLAIGLVNKDASLKQKGVYMASSFAANVIVTHISKNLINRKRPIERDPTFTTVVGAGSRSFPSGHTSEAFSMATSVTISFPKWYVAVPAYTFAGLVGYSRMYLGVHYPTDVMAGAVLGTASAWCMHKANQWLQRKKTVKRAQD